MPLRLLFIAFYAALCSSALAAAEPITLKLWPESPPSAMAPKSEATIKQLESMPPNPNRVTDVTDPTITIYRPEKPNGASVIVAPGGGYMFLSWAHEGTQVCEWLNSLGVTGVLLKYRTPTRDEKLPYLIPVQDGKRALELVREHAREWGLDPKRVGFLGFSAGANLAGHLAWDRMPPVIPQTPDTVAPRPPDFLIFIYGGGFLDKEDKTKFSEGFSIPHDAPPAFFLVAHDDKTNPIETAMIYLEYRKLKIPAEVHIFTNGGHGFGMRKDKNPINDWPARCGEWMKAMGYLGVDAVDSHSSVIMPSS
jgi:acetyl esterase/lipase